MSIVMVLLHCCCNCCFTRASEIDAARMLKSVAISYVLYLLIERVFLYGINFDSINIVVVYVYDVIYSNNRLFISYSPVSSVEIFERFETR